MKVSKKALAKALEVVTRELLAVQTRYEKAIKVEEGKLPNKRGGFSHLHSGMTECGQAYQDAAWNWAPCKKLVNHKGQCGYADNTAF